MSHMSGYCTKFECRKNSIDHWSDPRRGKGQSKRGTGASTRRFQQLLSGDKTPMEMIVGKETTREEAESSRALKGHALRGTERTELWFK